MEQQPKSLKERISSLFNKNNNPKKNDGVALIIARHSHAQSQNISAYGAAYAYLTGKYLCDKMEISYPDHIFYSPVARARNTAKMHQLAMKLNDIPAPAMSYDIGFHEHASTNKAIQSLDDALLYAQSQDMQTIEIVGHEPTISSLLSKFKGIATKNEKIEYGGCVIITADSWKNLKNGQIKEIKYCKSSKDLADSVLGKQQAKVLDGLMYQGKTSGQLDLSDFISGAKDLIRQAIREENNPKTAEKYSPIEFLEILDAYKLWGSSSMTAVGIAPDEKNPFYSDAQRILLGDNSYFNQKFLTEFNYRSEEKMDDSDSTQPYPVFNAIAQLIAEKRGALNTLNEENEEIAEKMEDFPPYRDIIQAGEGRRLINDKEVKDIRSPSYHITKKEQHMHDKIAETVQHFKDNQR